MNSALHIQTVCAFFPVWWYQIGSDPEPVSIPLTAGSRSDYLTAALNLGPFRWCNRICSWICLRWWEPTAGFLQLCSVTNRLINIKPFLHSPQVKWHHVSDVFPSSAPNLFFHHSEDNVSSRRPYFQWWLCDRCVCVCLFVGVDTEHFVSLDKQLRLCSHFEPLVSQLAFIGNFSSRFQPWDVAALTSNTQAWRARSKLLIQMDILVLDM